MLQLGRESEVSACGRVWKTSRLTVGLIEAFRDWIALQEGDPFADLPDRYLDRLDPAAAAALLREGKDVKDQLRGFSLSCPLAQKWLRNERGGAKLLQLLLLKHHAGVTVDEAFDVLVEVGQAKAEQVVADAHGQVPAEAGSPNDPGPTGRAPL